MAATGPETNTSEEVGSPLERLRTAFGRLTNQQKTLLMVAVAALIALLVASSIWFKQPNFRILFSNISERDGGAIIAALDQMNVPYRLSEGGGAILIAADKVHEVRLRLATQGLPKGGGVGFELMENQKFGTSQFAEQVNYQRGLEGELARTIQSIGAVQAARVHLAIPKPSVFVREELKPSASVLLNLYAGRSLDPAQIIGIQNLVATSVPNLTASSVTLIDQTGAMLSQLKSRLTDAGLDPAQLKYVQEIEASAIKRMEDILSPILGRGNYRVQVAADIDFSQSEQTAESHRPNGSAADASIRSQQTSESASTTSSAQGIPGALSNQPPVPATAPLTQPTLPAGTASQRPADGQPLQYPGQIDIAGVQAPISSVGQPINTRKDATINYELDRTIRHTKQAVGIIKRLTAAVVVNYRKDAKGTAKPLADPELRQINDLLKEALGFSQERGDSVSVANAPFAPIDEREDIALSIWDRPEELMNMGGLLLKYALVAIIAAILLFKVILPLVRQMLGSGREELQRQLGRNIDIVDEEGNEGSAGTTQTMTRRIGRVRELAQQDPKVVANIIKSWTGSNAG